MNRISLYLSFIVFIFLSLDSISQEEYPISAGGTIETCGGAFLDSGSQAGDYQAGENYTITFCPETEGDVVYVEFLTADIICINNNNCDELMVFDGDNTGANQMGAVNGAITYTASPLNTTGCLTFQFTSNGTDQGAGWSATITCDTPCDRPIANAVTSPNEPMPIKVCIDEEITFDGTTSEVAVGQTISSWEWDFRDGTIDTSGPIVTHSYSEPGEYIVQLYLVDDNDCASTNRTDIQIWVATEPNWVIDYPLGTTTCLGDTLCLVLDTDTLPVTWDAQPTIDLGGGVLVPDIVGECFESEIEFNGFSPGQTLNNINDLLDIYVNFEHSFMGDLLIQVICPDGTTVNLHEQGGGGTNLGIANQADDGVPGEGWDYWWAVDAPNGIWADEAAGVDILPTGTYSTVGNLADLVGCPLNGVWSLSMCDLWGADDGYVFEWAINFNPDLYPELTQFTPSYGDDPDSTYWSGPYIINQDYNLDSICIVPDVVGEFEYTATVTNNFGCTSDSIVTLSIYQAQAAYAGEDLIFCGADDILQGGLDDISGGSCNDSGGAYEYCYSNNDNTTFVYCPDELDGTTMMSIEFFAGEIEGNWDQINIYDGANIFAPLLGTLSGVPLAGNSYTASTNGCLTMQITSDGSVSCGSGSFDPMEYTVGCGVANDYVFNWSPADNVSDNTIPNPEILQLALDNQFILETYPLGHMACATLDTVVVLPAFDFDIGFIPPTCIGNNGEINVNIDPNNSLPPWTVTIMEAEQIIEDIVTFDGSEDITGLLPGDYTVMVSNGECSYDYSVVLPDVVPSTIETLVDSTICIGGTASLYAWSEQDPDNSWQYVWDNNLGTASNVSDTPLTTTTYTVYGIDDFNCETEPVTTTISLYDPLTVTIDNDTTICKGGNFNSEVLSSDGGFGAYEYSWNYSGADLGEENTVSSIASNPGTLCVVMTDGCETPSATACMEVIFDPELTPLITSDVTSGCSPLKVEFDIPMDTTLFDQTFWTLGDGSTIVNDDSFIHTYNDAGSYSIDLTITSNLGCDYYNTFTNYIQVFDNPIAGFYATPQPTKIPDTEITFHNISIGDISSYNWQINDNGTITESNEQEPVYEFPNDFGGEYDVSLTVTNTNGCQDEVIHTVVIDEILNIWVPNAFTPNSDGINDFFYVKGTDIDPAQYHLMVFNRWGILVYETKDIDAIWAGDRQDGEYYYNQNEVYVWRIIAYSASTNERIEVKGNITILR